MMVSIRVTKQPPQSTFTGSSSTRDDPPSTPTFLSLPTLSDQNHRKQGQQVCKVRAKMGKFILQESSKHMGEYF